MAEQARFSEGHEHSSECADLYREWKRYHAVVMDTAGRFARAQVLEARREREKYEHQLRLIGCSGEALRREERDREIAEFGRPLLD
jgi:hypothetical protein